MTRDEILRLIKHKLGFRLNYDDDIIFAHLDLVQVQYEKVTRERPLPWFLLNTSYTVDTVADTRSVARPPNFLAFADDWPLTIVDGENKRRQVCRTNAYNLGTTDYSASGLPTNFIFNNTVLDLYPLPDKVYTITIPHYARTEAWSQVETNDWFTEFPELVIEEVAYSLHTSNRDVGGLKMLNLSKIQASYFTRVNEMEQTHKAGVVNSNG